MKLNRVERRASIKKHRRTKITSVITARNFLGAEGFKETEMSDLEVTDALKTFYGIKVSA